jgi:hypothetical protein
MGAATSWHRYASGITSKPCSQGGCLLCRAELVCEKEWCERLGRAEAETAARLRETDAALHKLQSDWAALQQKQAADESEHAAALGDLRGQLEASQRALAETRSAHESTTAAFNSAKATQQQLQVGGLQ